MIGRTIAGLGDVACREVEKERISIRKSSKCVREQRALNVSELLSAIMEG